MQFAAAAFRTLGWTLAGSIVVPLAILLLTLAIVAFDSKCGGPGDSGGCAMGVASIVMAAVPFGALIGFCYGLWRAVKKHRALKAPVSSNSVP